MRLHLYARRCRSTLFKLNSSLPVAVGLFGVCFEKNMLFNLFPSSEGVDGTVAHPKGCPMVPSVSFRHELKKKSASWLLIILVVKSLISCAL